MPLFSKRRQVLFRQPEQADRRPEPLPMFRVGRMFELLLQMNKSAGGLDQALKVLRVGGSSRRLEPDLLENIVGFIVTLLVPAVKKRAVIRMPGDPIAIGFRFAAFQRLHEL